MKIVTYGYGQTIGGTPAPDAATSNNGPFAGGGAVAPGSPRTRRGVRGSAKSSYILGAQDPRHRRTNQAFTTGDVYVWPMGLDNTGRVAVDLDAWYDTNRRYAITVGNAVADTIDIKHRFGTRDLQVSVYRVSDGVVWESGGPLYNALSFPDNETVRVGFASAPALDSHRVVIGS